MRLKSAFGWFAAGRETEEALQLLSDRAFRLFMWICLRADRRAGSLPLDATQLARVLRRGTQEILRSVDELTHVGVCRLIHDRIVIQERFWPYERTVADP